MSRGNLKKQSLISKQQLNSSQWDQSSPRIPILMTKISKLSSQIQLQNTFISFKTMNLQEEDKLILSPEYQKANLNRLQNYAQMKKANRYLMQRRRKIETNRQLQNTSNENDKKSNKKAGLNKNAELNTVQSKIDQIFSIFNGQSFLKKQEHSKEQQKFWKGNNQKSLNPFKIKYFRQLKKHNKIYNFTVQKVREKNSTLHLKQDEKKGRLSRLLDGMRGQATINQQKKELYKYRENKIQCQAITDRIIARIFTRKKSRQMSETMKSLRTKNFQVIQAGIMDKVNSSSFSKRNYQKLKMKLNDLAHEIYKVDSKHKEHSSSQQRSKTTSTFRKYF